MNLTHTIAEFYLRRATEQPLRPWERWFLRRHLAGCLRCCRFAMDLAEFSHEEAAMPRREANLLHQRVTLALRRQRDDERFARHSRELQQRPLVSSWVPGFAVAAAALALVLLVVPEATDRGPAAGSASPRLAQTWVPTPAQPEAQQAATLTATTTATALPTPKPTPTASPAAQPAAAPRPPVAAPVSAAAAVALSATAAQPISPSAR